MNESNRIFSEAMKNVIDSMKVLIEGMRASMLMLKKAVMLKIRPPARQKCMPI